MESYTIVDEMRDDAIAARTQTAIDHADPSPAGRTSASHTKGTTMNADDMIREAANEAAEETLSDRRISPDEEEERLSSLIKSAYRAALEYKTSGQVDGADYRREYCTHPDVPIGEECPHCGTTVDDPDA